MVKGTFNYWAKRLLNNANPEVVEHAQNYLAGSYSSDEMFMRWLYGWGLLTPEVLGGFKNVRAYDIFAKSLFETHPAPEVRALAQTYLNGGTTDPAFRQWLEGWGLYVAEPGAVPPAPKKKFIQKVGSTLSAAAKNVKETVLKITDNGKEAAALALFLPLAPVGRAYLIKRGVQPSNDTKTLVSQIATEKAKGFGYSQSYGFVDPATILAVVAFLKNIIDKIKDKKKKGEEMTADEKAIADKLPEIDKALGDSKAAASEILDETEGPVWYKNWKIWLVIIILVVLFLVFRKKVF